MRVTNNGFIPRGLAAARLLGGIRATRGGARAQPVTLRGGSCTAGEGPLWRDLAEPALAGEQGTADALPGARCTAATRGAEDLRWQGRGGVRRGADRLGREGRISQEERRGHPCLAGGPEGGDAVLSREAARGGPAPDRRQDGPRRTRRLSRHDRLFSRA